MKLSKQKLCSENSMRGPEKIWLFFLWIVFWISMFMREEQALNIHGSIFNFWVLFIWILDRLRFEKTVHELKNHVYELKNCSDHFSDFRIRIYCEINSRNGIITIKWKSKGWLWSDRKKFGQKNECSLSQNFWLSTEPNWFRGGAPRRYPIF